MFVSSTAPHAEVLYSGQYVYQQQQQGGLEDDPFVSSGYQEGGLPKGSTLSYSSQNVESSGKFIV